MFPSQAATRLLSGGGAVNERHSESNSYDESIEQKANTSTCGAQIIIDSITIITIATSNCDRFTLMAIEHMAYRWQNTLAIISRPSPELCCDERRV